MSARAKSAQALSGTVRRAVNVWLRGTLTRDARGSTRELPRCPITTTIGQKLINRIVALRCAPPTLRGAQ